MESIYNLKLHQTINANSLNITRVPGGWIYQLYVQRKDNDTKEWKWQLATAIFVPFDNEFQSNEFQSEVKR